MAKKQIEGQMDLFELFDSVEEFEENIKSTPQTKGVLMKTSTPVMKKGFYDTARNMRAVVAYMDYNLVYIKGWEDDPVMYQFEQSKDAVNFYLAQIEFYLRDKKLMVEENPIVEPEVIVIPWVGEDYPLLLE